MNNCVVIKNCALVEYYCTSAELNRSTYTSTTACLVSYSFAVVVADSAERNQASTNHFDKDNYSTHTTKIILTLIWIIIKHTFTDKILSYDIVKKKKLMYDCYVHCVTKDIR